MPGDWKPDVVMLPPVAEMRPPPRSVARAAELAPAVEIFVLTTLTDPPPLAITPWAYCPATVLLLSITEADAPVP
jgi:hypothetical protein